MTVGSIGKYSGGESLTACGKCGEKQVSWNSVHSLCIPYLSHMVSLILAEMSFLQPVTLEIRVIWSVSG